MNTTSILPSPIPEPKAGHAHAGRSPLRRLAGRAAGAALVLSALGGAALATAPQARADTSVGQPAPGFSLKDLSGRNVQLADYKGRTVVLEWHNPGCPFVQKHYDSGNLPSLQKKHAADVVWIAVNSTHAGHPDYRDAAGHAKYLKDKGAAQLTYLLDTDGRVGMAYGARTTPQMFVIDKAGTLVYAGAIDSIRSANPADIARSTNHVAAALDDVKAGRPVSVATTTPYGCSVKYK